MLNRISCWFCFDSTDDSQNDEYELRLSLLLDKIQDSGSWKGKEARDYYRKGARRDLDAESFDWSCL